MAEFGVGFRFFAKTEEMVAGMRSAGEEAKVLKRTLGDTFGESSIWKNLTTIGLGTTLIRGLMSAADSAQKLRDEAEKMGKTVDDATLSVAALGDGFDALKKFGSDASIFLVSRLTYVGEAAGSLINRLRGISAEQEEAAIRAATNAEAAERRLAKAREENSPEKIREAEERLASARLDAFAKNADEVGKIFVLLQREKMVKEEIARVGEATVKGLELQGELEKYRAEIASETAKLKKIEAKEAEEALEAEFKAIDETLAAREKLKKLKFESLTASEQEVVLSKELSALEREYRETRRDGLETTDVEILLLEKGNQLAKVRADIEKEAANEAERSAKAAAKRVEEEQKLRILGPIRGGGTFNELSDEALQEIIRRNRSQAANITNPALFGPSQAGFNQGEAARLRFEAENAEAVLRARDDLRRDVRLMGIEGARSTFRGDPTQFDALVQRFVQDTRTAQEIARETNQNLFDINQRLLKAGFSK